MRILAMDTALGECSAAVVDVPGGVRGVRCVSGKGIPDSTGLVRRGRGRPDDLFPIIDGLLRDSGGGLDVIDRIAVTVGPGSFTGIRVGIAAARGFSLALGVPVVGIGTLEALVWGLWEKDDFRGNLKEAAGGDGRVTVVLPAAGEEVYFQSFSWDGESTGEVGKCQASDLAKSLKGPYPVLCGGGAGAVVEASAQEVRERLQIVPITDMPDPVTLAMMASREPFSSVPVRPVYLRSAVARGKEGRVDTMGRRDG